MKLVKSDPMDVSQEGFDTSDPMDVSQEGFEYDEESGKVIPRYLIEIPSMDSDHSKTYISNEIVFIDEDLLLDTTYISKYIGKTVKGEYISHATERIHLHPKSKNIHLFDIPADRGEIEIISGPIIAIHITEIIEKTKSSGIHITYKSGLDDGTKNVVTKDMGWFLFPLEFVKKQMKIYPQYSAKRLADHENLKKVAKVKKIPRDMENTIFSFLGGRNKQKRRISRRKNTRNRKTRKQINTRILRKRKN
jgi:hypothetical protein